MPAVGAARRQVRPDHKQPMRDRRKQRQRRKHLHFAERSHRRPQGVPRRRRRRAPERLPVDRVHAHGRGGQVPQVCARQGHDPAGLHHRRRRVHARMPAAAAAAALALALAAAARGELAAPEPAALRRRRRHVRHGLPRPRRGRARVRRPARRHVLCARRRGVVARLGAARPEPRLFGLLRCRLPLHGAVGVRGRLDARPPARAHAGQRRRRHGEPGAL